MQKYTFREEIINMLGRNKFIRQRKGQASATEILMVIITTAAMLMIALQIPKIVHDMWTLLSLASAESVARDLAGLITISYAATDESTIDYIGADENVFYDIEIEKRVVKINGVRYSSKNWIDDASIEKISSSFSIGTAKIAMDINASLSGLNNFRIRKYRVDGENVCNVGAG